jgi:azurin
MKNLLFLLLLATTHLLAQAPKNLPKEEDYYKILTLPLPEGVVLEAGGLATLPDGKIAVSTRRGEVWTIENPYMNGASQPRFNLFASGMHECLGLAYKDNALYLAQRGELTKLIDKDGDGKADVYETVYAWPLSGHYHEYSYGPKIASDGSFFVTGNVAFGDQAWWRGESRVPFRGWTMRISPDGKMEPWATGMRSPCGIGFIDDTFFYGDNQGDWMGSGFIMPVSKGDFTGHPAGLRWTSGAEMLPNLPVKITEQDIYARINPHIEKPGEAAVKPENDPADKGITLFEMAKEVPGIRTPAVWLPHGILGISTSEITRDETAGGFGPFAGQIFVGDQGQSKVDRVFLEKVNGVYQGAAFPFREGFQSGVLRMCWGHDGSLFVGQTNRGWGSTGKDPYGLQRLVWTGKTPFEMKAIRATADGFEMEFTQPVDKKAAADPLSYQITGFIYKYHPVYGSPVINDKICNLTGIQVSEDGLRVRVGLDNLREKYVHEIKAVGLKNAEGLPLLHSSAYYTLNIIPQGEKLAAQFAVKPISHAAHNMMKAPETVSPDGKGKTAIAKPAAKTGKRMIEMPADWNGKADYTFDMGTKPGLKYDRTELEAKAGSKIRLTFNNVDDMPHNWVLVMPGTANDIGMIALNMGLDGMKLNYIPNSPKVLHHTKLMQPGTSESIYFTAPLQPGSYTYVCTYPGHSMLMQGTLKIVR